MVENEWWSLRSDHEVLRPSGRLDAVPNLGLLEILPVKVPGRRAGGNGGGRVPEPGPAGVVARGGHPRTWFYRAFATMARSAWALRAATARCLEHGVHGVRMLYARRGSEYVEELMESVAAPAYGVGEGEGDTDTEEKLSVAFTVTPGVKVGATVVACRVLLRQCRHQEGFIQIQ